MRAKRVGLAFIAFVAPAVIILGADYKFWRDYDRGNRNDINLWGLIGYSQPVYRNPHTTLLFRYYGFEGEELLKADVKLNNLGLISASDYHKEKSAGEFRIIVLGGEQTASSVSDRSWPDFLEAELSARLKGRKIKVLNFAWPDAGPQHYIEYWEREARQYQPDLVIVNFVEADFYRTIHGAELTYQGKQLVGHQISYDVNGATAKVNVCVVRGTTGPVSLLNPMVVASRPYGAFLDKKFFEDRSLVKKLQETIVDQQIAGVSTMDRTDLYPLLIDYWKGGRPLSALIDYWRGKNKRNLLPPVSEIRNFDPPKQAPADKDKLVQFGVRTFGWIVRNIPNAILIHNFHYGELGQQFELTEKMMAGDPRIVVHDMRKQIPPETSDSQLRGWYLIPHMGEKWSVRGHEAYAKLVADLLIAQKRIR